MMPTAQQHIPDILDCLAQLSNDEVPTPPKLAREMLDLLPDEVWSQPDYKWLDPFCKSGVFLREVATRLFDGLSGQIPDFEERRDHIYREMLWGTSITEMTGMISRRTLYCSHNAAGDHSVVRFDDPAGNLPFVYAEHDFGAGGRENSCLKCGGPAELERGEGRENYAYSFIHGMYPTEEMSGMKFDVIVGNPPYQIDSDGNTRTKPVYQLFVQQAIDMEPKHVVMITPSRWFAGGLGLGDFRTQMLNSRQIRELVDYVDPTDCFPGVDIQAGVSYFHWDRDHDGDTYISTGTASGKGPSVQRPLNEFDLLVRDNRAVSIIRKVRALNEPTLADRVSKRVPFGLQSNFKPKSSGSVTVFARNRSTHPVSVDDITSNASWVERHKVLMPVAYGERGHGPYFVLGKPFVAGLGTACTDTYVVAGVFDSSSAAEHYRHYLGRMLPRFLVLQRKISQHLTNDRFSFVPDLPMDREWTDEMLYERYGLTDEEIEYVESQIKPMESDDE